MSPSVTYELTTATVNVATLGLPKATGNVTFIVAAYSADKLRLTLAGTDLRLGKGTTYTVETTIMDLADILEAPPAIGRHNMTTYATVTGRTAIAQIKIRLSDIALAALSALVDDSGFAEWIIAATAETLRAKTIPSLEHRIKLARHSLAVDEHELEAYIEQIVTVGPLPIEQLRSVLELKNRMNLTKQSLAGDELDLQACIELVAAVGPLTYDQLKLALVLTRNKYSLGLAIHVARKI